VTIDICHQAYTLSWNSMFDEVADGGTRKEQTHDSQS
jgi:hypothetical protein